LGRSVKAVAEARLRESRDLAGHPTACEFREGTLTLRGRVPTYSLKQAARRLLEGIHGVKVIDNQIDVIPVPLSDDSRDDRGTSSQNDRHRY
jgi:osmotically-inducible protein OsmY